jgi:hypothetical protein
LTGGEYGCASAISRRGRDGSSEFSTAGNTGSGLTIRKKSTAACSKKEIAKATISGFRAKTLL